MKKTLIALFIIVISIIGLEKAASLEMEWLVTLCAFGFVISVFYLVIQLVLYEVNKIDYD